MPETQITVQYERKLSDGQYGSEGLVIAWTGPHDQAYGEIAAALRVQVLAFLAQSTAPEVAWKARHELQPGNDDVPVAIDAEEIPF